MKIAIDARMLYATGIGRYARELIDGLQEIDERNEYTIILRSQDSELWKPDKPNFKVVLLDAPIYSFGEQTALPRLLRKLKPDLVHFLNFNSPVWYGGKRVTTVHDLTLLDYSVARGSSLKRLVYSIKRQVLKFQIRAVLRGSSAIITETETVRQELVRRGLAKPDRTTAILAGVPLWNKPVTPQKMGIKPPFLLYVGNFFPYKNIGRLVSILPQLVDDHPGLKLVLAGQRDQFRDELKAQAEKLGVSEQMVFTGFVRDEELAWLYQNASLYVFPSLSEGFGMPGLEAMAAGLPVASSNASCLPEVYADAAAYFDPLDTEEMANTIAKLLKTPDELERLKKAGLERVKQFSWRRMTKQTLDVYERALRS